MYTFDGRRVMVCHQILAGFAQVLIYDAGMSRALDQGMKSLKWLRHGLLILILNSIAILEGYYLPRYGIEWMLAAMGATAFLAGFWIRNHWDVDAAIKVRLRESLAAPASAAPLNRS